MENELVNEKISRQYYVSNLVVYKIQINYFLLYHMSPPLEIIFFRGKVRH